MKRILSTIVISTIISHASATDLTKPMPAKPATGSFGAYIVPQGNGDFSAAGTYRGANGSITSGSLHTFQGGNSSSASHIRSNGYGVGAGITRSGGKVVQGNVSVRIPF